MIPSCRASFRDGYSTLYLTLHPVLYGITDKPLRKLQRTEITEPDDGYAIYLHTWVCGIFDSFRRFKGSLCRFSYFKLKYRIAYYINGINLILINWFSHLVSENVTDRGFTFIIITMDYGYTYTYVTHIGNIILRTS